MGIRALWVIASILLVFTATLQSADAASAGPETARCMNAALIENGLTLRSARRLPVGKELRISTYEVTLVRGDTVWGLCALLGRVALTKPVIEEKTPTVVPSPSPAPAHVAVGPSKTEKEATIALEAAKKELKSLQDAKKADEARISSLETTLGSWKSTAFILGLALLVALIALALIATLLFKEKRARTVLAAKIAPTPGTEGTDELDPIPFTLAHDAVKAPHDLTNLTFFIRPRLLSRARMGEPWEMSCELPWGTRTTYAPDQITKLFHSEDAGRFFAKHGIVLKSDVRGDALLREPLPTSIEIPLATVHDDRQEAA